MATYKNEGSIEKSFNRKMMSSGLVYKNIKMGKDGWPDRMIILQHERVLWIEFKYPGRVPTPRQKMRIEFLESMGHSVSVQTDPDEAIQWVKACYGEEKSY